MGRASTFFVLVICILVTLSGSDASGYEKKKHHRKHRHHHKHHHDVSHKSNANSTIKTHAAANASVVAQVVKGKSVAAKQSFKTKMNVQINHVKVISDKDIVNRMRTLEKELEEKEAKVKTIVREGHIEVNGPLPVDFKAVFAKSVSMATGGQSSDFRVIATAQDPQAKGAVEVTFSAPVNIVQAVEDQAADPDSKLANGPLHSFLVAGDDVSANTMGASATMDASASMAAVVPSSGVDVDVEMPYGDLEPFGREDTAQELTEDSVKESDAMVDQLERAEVAEEKRAVFRALTRLRGAAITSFDGIARSQTGNIDQYNKLNKWRNSHPLHHLADEEADVSKWAFPDNADF